MDSNCQSEIRIDTKLQGLFYICILQFLEPGLSQSKWSVISFVDKRINESMYELNN